MPDIMTALEDSGRAATDPNVDAEAPASLPQIGLSRSRALPAALRGFLPEILLLTLTTAAGFWAAGRWLTPFGDPGGWWTLLHRLGSGERLYRDIYLQYGPLSPYALALLGRLFGLSPTSFLLMNWIPAILLGLLLLRAGRHYLSEMERFAVLGLLLGLGLFGPGTARLVLPYSPAAVHALVFSVLALLLLQRQTPRRGDAFAAGGLAGLAFCSKQEIGLVALFAICVPVLARSSRSWRWLLLALGGFLCVAGPGVLVVLWSAPLESLRYDSHFWPIAEVPESWKYLSGLTTGLLIYDWPARLGRAVLAFLYDAALVGLLGLLVGRDSRIRRPLLLALVGALLIGGAADGILLWQRADPLSLSVLVAFAVLLLALFDRARQGRDFLMAVGLFAGLVATRTVFAGRSGWSSYSGVTNVSTALTWALFLFCFLPKLWPGGGLAALATRRIWAFTLLAVATYGTWIGARGLRVAREVTVETPRGRVWIGERAAPLFAALGKNLRPGERALVLPEPNGVEALFQLRSASPLLYHMPGWLDARAEEQLLHRFEGGGPDVVVVFGRPTWEFDVEPFGQGFGRRLASWLETNYSVVASPLGGIILRRKPPG
jgi:hypothetical protein